MEVIDDDQPQTHLTFIVCFIIIIMFTNNSAIV